MDDTSGIDIRGKETFAVVEAHPLLFELRRALTVVCDGLEEWSAISEGGVWSCEERGHSCPQCYSVAGGELSVTSER